MKRTVVEYLNEVRAKIEAGWCQHAAARNDAGDEVHIDDPSATRVCLVTAIYQTVPQEDIDKVYAPIMSICGVVKQFQLTSWNNDPAQTQASVLRMLDQAIEKAS